MRGKKKSSSEECFSPNQEPYRVFERDRGIQQDENTQETQGYEESSFNNLLPPSQPIIEKDYSLEADLIFGWQPKPSISGPVPLTFSQSQLNRLIQSLHTYQNSIPQQYQLVYLGMRPTNSLKMHMSYAENSGLNQYPYKFKATLGNASRILVALDIRLKKQFPMPFLGMNPSLREQHSNEIIAGQETCNLKHSTLIFNSLFESGNLDCVIKVAQNEYDLFMRVDSNSKGHLQWYYFKVSGAVKGERVKFNICNFSKGKSLYLRGMRPFLLSEINGAKSEWMQGGEKIQFGDQEWRYNSTKEEEENPKCKKFYTLSFEYEFKDSKEIASFAYCPPYTLSDLQKFLKNVINSSQAVTNKFLKEQKLCTTMSGLEVPLLSVTNFSSSQEEINKRKVIVVIARIHPGESNSSYMMQGFIEHILSDKAQFMRDQCIFKIVPMMNPDGVVLGNYRTGLAGKDLNRIFKSSDRVVFPTVAALKDLVNELKRVHQEKVVMFLDLHGHSVKKNVFAYGPEYPIFDLKYYTSRMFCKILAKNNEMFRYYSCIFRVNTMKRNTARGVFFKDFGIPNCFTIESSNGSFYGENKLTKEFTPQLWQLSGERLGIGVNEYIQSLFNLEEWQEINKSMKMQIKLEKEEINLKDHLQERRSSEGLFEIKNLRSKVNLLHKRGSIENNNKKIQSMNGSQIIGFDGVQQENRIKYKPDFSSLKFTLKQKSLENDFLVDQTPVFKYFEDSNSTSSKLEEVPCESDEFSEGGLDSESEGEDFDVNKNE